MKSDVLRSHTKDLLDNGGSLAELARQLPDVSRTLLSQWYNGSYPHDPRHIETKLAAHFARSARRSFRDERILQQIEELLQNAEDRKAIVATIALRG